MRRLPPVWRVVLLAVAVLVGLNLLAVAFDAASGQRPGGPRSSSYATGGDGLAALHDLVRDFDGGRPVARLRGALSGSSLDPETTVFVLDPRSVSLREARALRRFVSAGGRLVAGGREPAAWLGEIVERVPSWVPGGARARAVGGAAELAGVRSVTTARRGRWDALHGARGGDLVAFARVGRGEVAMLADASPLWNRRLARADNAALGVALAGPRSRRVVFAEGVHGYGVERGLEALPSRWQWAVGGLLLAALLWVWSRWRRLGPIENEQRPLPPPRRAHVDAVAAALARTGAPAASAERVREAARARVARRAGLGSDPPDDALRAAAVNIGLSEDEAAALTRPARDDDEDLLLAGRALAKAGGGDG